MPKTEIETTIHTTEDNSSLALQIDSKSFNCSSDKLWLSNQDWFVINKYATYSSIKKKAISIFL